MPKILFQTADGTEILAEAKVGQSAMRAATAIGVPGIDADCGGECMCATCHVHVAPDWLDRVGPPGELEGEMIEFEAEPSLYSRLACQIVMTELLDGVRLRVVRD